jgi:uncharacterized protein
MNRRDLLQRTGAALLALGAAPFLEATAGADETKKRRLLMYTRSEGFEHPCVQRKGGKLSLAETIVTDLGKKHNFEVVCEKDGRIFLSREFPRFEGFVFETQGDLLKEECRDGSPPMTRDGKKALLDAIAEGKGFAGCHCASDTFHSKGHYQGKARVEQKGDDIDPYIRMLGGEFISHGSQQKAWMRLVDDKFPGADGLKDFALLEEWYSLKNFAPDLHVILVQDTEGMKKTGGDVDYARPNYPAAWARMHHKGRVFFTSMGHRDDVWKNDIFQQLLIGGINWSLGRVEAKLEPNLEKVTPKAREMPPKR